jgi:hypothetical protein
MDDITSDDLLNTNNNVKQLASSFNQSHSSVFNLSSTADEDSDEETAALDRVLAASALRLAELAAKQSPQADSDLVLPQAVASKPVYHASPETSQSMETPEIQNDVVAPLAVKPVYRRRTIIPERAATTGLLRPARQNSAPTATAVREMPVHQWSNDAVRHSNVQTTHTTKQGKSMGLSLTKMIYILLLCRNAEISLVS